MLELTSEKQPFSPKTILRLCVVLLVLVALAAGFYEVKDENWRGRYERLTKQYQLLEKQ